MINVLYLSGSKYYIDDYLKRVQDKLQADSVVKINGSQSDIYENLCMNMVTADPFGMKNLYLVQDLPPATKKINKKSAQELIIDCFNRVPETNVIIFYVYGSARHDKFKKALIESKGDKSVKNFKNIEDAKPVIKSILEKNKKIASDDVIKFIDEFFNSDLSIIEQEVAKLNYYLDDRKRTITKEDVIDVCIPNGEFVIWNFLKYMGSKNINRSLEHLYQFLYTDGNHEMVLAMLQREIRLNLVVKECLSQNMSEKDIFTKVKKIKKVRKTESGNNIMYSDYEIRKSIQFSTSFSKNYTFEDLLKSYKNLREANLRVRSKYETKDRDKELVLSLYTICYPAFELDFDSGLSYVE